MKIRIKYYFVAACLFFIAPLWGQSGQFEARVLSDKIIAGDVFEVVFQMKNLEGDGFTPPDFSPLIVVGSPNRSMQTRIINGHVTSSLSLTYLLSAPKAGKYTIPKASVKSGRSAIYTEPITINVISKKEASKILGEVDVSTTDFFLRLEPDSLVLYTGQQGSIDFKIYTTQNLDDIRFESEPSYDGFVAQYLNEFDRSTRTETVNGKEYRTQIIRKVSIYPQEPGVFDLLPVVAQAGKAKSNRRSRFGFTSRFDMDYSPMTSNMVHIEVKPLPEKLSECYTGLTGNYSLKSTIDVNQISTDDVVRVTVYIEGDGDPQRLVTPEIQFPEAFDVYDPVLKEDVRLQKEGKLWVRKSWEYLISPLDTGMFQVTPQICYLHPDSLKLMEAGSTSHRVRVVPGRNFKSLKNARARKKKQSVKITPPEITSNTQPLMDKPYWALIASILPLLTFLSISVYRWANSSLHFVKTESEEKKFSRLKRELEELIDKGAYDDFYKKMETEIEFRIGKQNAQDSLTTMDIVSSLEWSDELKEDIQILISRCQNYLYAPIKLADAQNDLTVFLKLFE